MTPAETVRKGPMRGRAGSGIPRQAIGAPGGVLSRGTLTTGIPLRRMPMNMRRRLPALVCLFAFVLAALAPPACVCPPAPARPDTCCADRCCGCCGDADPGGGAPSSGSTADHGATGCLATPELSGIPGEAYATVAADAESASYDATSAAPLPAAVPAPPALAGMRAVCSARSPGAPPGAFPTPLRV